jgi:hypothetical protein
MTEVHRACLAGVLAEIFRCLGIFAECRSSFSAGNGCGIGHRSRIPQPGGVKQRKPGSHWGVVL